MTVQKCNYPVSINRMFEKSIPLFVNLRNSLGRRPDRYFWAEKEERIFNRCINIMRYLMYRDVESWECPIAYKEKGRKLMEYLSLFEKNVDYSVVYGKIYPILWSFYIECYESYRQKNMYSRC